MNMQFTDTERLDFLVKHALYVREDYGTFSLWERVDYGEHEKWTPYGSDYIRYSVRQAIDLVMSIYQERNGTLD